MKIEEIFDPFVVNNSQRGEDTDQYNEKYIHNMTNLGSNI